MLLRLKIGLSSSDVSHNYKRSARNIMVIAGMPEDRSKTINNFQTPSNTFNSLQQPSKPYTPVCVHL
eukprot:11723856-Heterocapsa_arctica.AAC.1